MTRSGQAWLERIGGPYAILDPERLGGREPLAVADELLAGGARVLQLRAKRLGSREVVRLGETLARTCAEANVLFVMNDRVDLAVACGAAAVHLGQDDLPLDAARRIAPGLLFGVSTHDLGQVQAAIAAGADYLGFGPVFETTSKERPDPVVGIEGLARAVAAAGALPRSDGGCVPIVAIGGIAVTDAAAIAAAGAAAAAAIGAFAGAADPRAAVVAFARDWAQARAGLGPR